MALALLNPEHLLNTYGYAAIFLLCVLQSCCIPTSSELTMGFAGVLASSGQMNLAAAIAVGVVGEVVGAYIAWYVGRTAGRVAVDKYGKYVLVTHADLDRAERWYATHERWGVFGSRLIPLVRSFAALPAGVAEVPAVSFGLLTAAGSLIWIGAWASLGYALGSEWQSLVHGFTKAGYVLAALAVIGVAFVVLHRYRAYRRATSAQSTAAAAAETTEPEPGP